MSGYLKIWAVSGHISAASFPWRAVDQSERRRLNRTPSGSWHRPASSLTGWALLRLSSDLRGIVKRHRDTQIQSFIDMLMVEPNSVTRHMHTDRGWLWSSSELEEPWTSSAQKRFPNLQTLLGTWNMVRLINIIISILLLTQSSGGLLSLTPCWWPWSPASSMGL